jgi:signal transduction histidine kinase
MIHEESVALTGVIESLLELTRADSGPVLSLLPLDVRAIVLEVRSHAESMATQSGVQLRLAVTKDPVFVMGDKIALRRALLALIGNAIKFTPPSGQVRVTLSIRSGDVLFEVEDNGIGIAKEDLSRIFDRFYQVDRSRSGGGVGLGLSIAHWIAQEHGGRIEVESEIARGAIFRLVLPVSAETR